MKHFLFSFLLISSFLSLKSQELTQTIRGLVVDRVSQSPLPGVMVQLEEEEGMGCMTDIDGNFRLPSVAVGKHTIKVSFIGYKVARLSNISVNSGKELVLTIQLEEEITEMKQVVITDKRDKNKPLNEMSTVSARTFSVEETQKYAAAVNDPGRMATSFAGVVSADDGNNNISIRGNSPYGLLWRMEGVDIPNPNHFSSIGAAGGGISILSVQVLGNSDFSTGAFAAEYGNALSGVFDLKLRKGNSEKREYTIQAGLLGLDLAAEGPFTKGGDGSYLINYRYSTLSLLSAVGVDLGPSVTNFQDISFNLCQPTKRAGTFSLFGFGGLSDQYSLAVRDSLLWKKDDFRRYNVDFLSNTGAVGLTHTKLFKNDSYIRSVVAVSGTENGSSANKMLNDYETVQEEFTERYSQRKLTLTSSYTKKISASKSFRTGIIMSGVGFGLSMKERDDSTSLLTDKILSDENSATSQAFFQYNHRFNKKLSILPGIHYFEFLLNHSRSLEPRLALKYEANLKNTFTLGYGLHSQMQVVGLYFISTKPGVYPNRDLGLSKAHHVVIGYDHAFTEHTHIKIEPYYQRLYNIPVSIDSSNAYSVLNSVWDYQIIALENRGLGRNLGTDLTFEHFLYKDLYYLFSASVFDSRYRSSSGKWHSTKFNAGYAFTFTGGKEWTLSEKRKKRVIGLNIKTMWLGGFRYTPIDLAASQLAGETVLSSNDIFERHNPDYFRTDIRVSVKRNFTRVTSILALDIQNVSSRKNVGGQYYDSNTGEIKYWYQTPLIPVLSYRLEF